MKLTITTRDVQGVQREVRQVTLTPDEAERFDWHTNAEKNRALARQGFDLARAFYATSDDDGNVEYYQPTVGA